MDITTAIMRCFECTTPATVITFHILNNGIRLYPSYHSLISISIKLHTINNTIGTMDLNLTKWMKLF